MNEQEKVRCLPLWRLMPFRSEIEDKIVDGSRERNEMTLRVW